MIAQSYPEDAAFGWADAGAASKAGSQSCRVSNALQR